MASEICCIFRTFASYRESVYSLIDKEFHAEFYFGTSDIKLKEATPTLLSGYKKKSDCIELFKGVWWFSGIIKLPFYSYRVYLVDGNLSCISIWLLLLVNKLLGKKTYVWTHGWYGREGFIKKAIKRSYYALTTGVFLYGEYARNLMIKEKYPPDKLFCIANSLDYDKQLIFRNRTKTSSIFQNYFKNDFPVIIYVGRLQKVKRIDLLIKAINLLAQQNFRVNLMLVGDNVDIDNLEEMLHTDILKDRVCHSGASFDERQLSEYFYNADVCVSPGNVGLTAIHAFMYGCPVITHANFKNQMPEFEIIEDGKTGAFFKENNVEDLSYKIRKWLEYSNTHRETIREECYKQVDTKYNPYYQLNILKQIFNH